MQLVVYHAYILTAINTFLSQTPHTYIFFICVYIAMSSAGALVTTTEAVVKASYFTEVCNEVLKDPRFSCEKLESSTLFRSASTLLLAPEQEVTTRTFSIKLERRLEELFTGTLNLSKLWPAFNKLAVGDTLKLEWKRVL